MDNFIVSARKYRPASFDTVIGQSSITLTLKNSIKSHQLAHSYLFCGPRGVGKTTCARIFAKTINCSNVTDKIEACNTCDSCTAFNKSSSFNIHELDGASNNSVDDIRSLIEQVRIPPQVGKYSVYIIDEVHMLSTNAFNAFLKTLEEPPAHAIFILATTEKHKIIPTILSRCQIFDFNRIGINDIVEHLKSVAGNEGIKADPDGLNVIAQKADGALRDALSIFDQVVSFSGNDFSYEDVINNLNVLDYEYFFKFIEYFIQGNISSSLNLLDDVLKSGFDGHHLIQGISKHIRDLLVCKDTETISLLEVGENIKEKYLKQSSLCSVSFLFNALNKLSQADINYKSANNKRLHVELVLLQLCNIVESRVESDQSVKEVTNERKEVKSENKTVEVKKNIVQEPDSSKGAYKPLTPSIKKFKNITDKNFIPEQKEEKNKSDDEESKKLERRDKVFMQEELSKLWQEFASKFNNEEETRKYALVNKHEPILKENFTIDLSVSTQIQKETFEREIFNEILVFLKNHLENDLIQLNILVTEKKEEHKKKLYTDNDKYNHLKEINPDIDKLQQKFNLDFK